MYYFLVVDKQYQLVNQQNNQVVFQHYLIYHKLKTV